MLGGTVTDICDEDSNYKFSQLGMATDAVLWQYEHQSIMVRMKIMMGNWQKRSRGRQNTCTPGYINQSNRQK